MRTKYAVVEERMGAVNEQSRDGAENEWSSNYYLFLFLRIASPLFR